jgi:hypothetical protein
MHPSFMRQTPLFLTLQLTAQPLVDPVASHRHLMDAESIELAVQYIHGDAARG